MFTEPMARLESLGNFCLGFVVGNICFVFEGEMAFILRSKKA